MLRKLALRAVRALLNWRMAGRPVAFLAPNKTVSWEGVVMGVIIDWPRNIPVVMIGESGSDIHAIRHVAFGRHFHWNAVASRFEVEDNGLDYRARPNHERSLGAGSYRDGDRQAAEEEPQRRESPESPSGAQASSDRGLDREGQDRDAQGHHESFPAESAPDGSDRSGTSSDADREGHARTLTYSIGIHDGLPSGLLVGVDPQQRLYLHKLGEFSPPMPDGTVIWGNALTVDQIQRSARASGHNVMTMQ